MMSGKKIESEQVTVDDVMAQLGSYGKYQIRTLILLGLPAILGGMYNANYVFSAGDVDYRCRIEECEGVLINPSFNESWLKFAAPQNRSRQCYRYSLVQDPKEPICRETNFNSSLLKPCREWVYKSDESIVSEFNLACEEWKRTLVGTVRSVGLIVSLIITGQVSDRLGRKVMIYIAGTLTGVLGIAKSFSISYLMFISFEFLEAALGYGFNSAAYVLTIESVHKDQRIFISSTMGIIYSLGGIIFATIAWKMHQWRNLLRVIYPPAIIFIAYIFVLDESIRWLLSRGKKTKALEIIVKAARINAVTINNKTLIQLEHTSKKSESVDDFEKVSPFRETLKSKEMVKRLLICFVWWSVATFVHYGMFVHSVSLSGNKYVNFGLTSLMEIPANVMVICVLSQCGRKKSLMVSFLLAGMFCMSLTFVDKTISWLTLTLFLLGKLFSAFSFSVLYVYTSELFPTYTRNSMHALCSCVGRLGSILAPQTPLLEVYMPSLPTILFGSFSLLAGLLTVLTPDTRGARLPDNVQQAEQIERLGYHGDFRRNKCQITTAL